MYRGEYIFPIEITWIRELLDIHFTRGMDMWLDIYLGTFLPSIRTTRFVRGKSPDLPSWWRHLMETFSALLVLCAGNSPVTGKFPWQRLMTRSFHIFLDMCLDKRLNKRWGRWWFDSPSRSLWRHCNVLVSWRGISRILILHMKRCIPLFSKSLKITFFEMPMSSIGWPSL